MRCSAVLHLLSFGMREQFIKGYPEEFESFSSLSNAESVSRFSSILDCGR